MAVQGARITVGTAATLLSGAETDTQTGSRIVVRNASTVAVSLGGSTVTSTSGYELPAGAVQPFTLDAGDQLYAAVAVGSEVVHVVRTGV